MASEVVSFVEESVEFTTFSSDYITSAFDARNYRKVTVEVNVTTFTGTSIQVDIESAIELEGGYRVYESIAITGTGRQYGWISDGHEASPPNPGSQSVGFVRLRFMFSAVTAFACTARGLLKA